LIYGIRYISISPKYSHFNNDKSRLSWKAEQREGRADIPPKGMLGMMGTLVWETNIPIGLPN